MATKSAGRARSTSKKGEQRAVKRRAISKDSAERYEIDLLIKHPDMTPDAITAGLRLAPEYFWQRGTPRRTPAGMALGGVRKETMWRYVARQEGRRNFFAGVRELVARLLLNRDFLIQLIAGGGRVVLIVN